ncbi:peptidase C14, partial [Candidatus Endoriftia persephone str. Guaymas]|nr:peptidase C14 [Candidatus Endoriftia persephone str. Guaymas]
SMFANALIDVLSESKRILEGSKLFREVKSRVSARAEELNVDQSPQYAQLKRTGHEFGEFLLVGQR